MENSSFWERRNNRLTNLFEERNSQALNAYNQQLQVEPDGDVTSLIFPAIGALLMLLFGGILLSSASICCKALSTDRTEKNRKNKVQRKINFAACLPQPVYPQVSSVLQQENNDVVNAVKETYTDLPQYAPVCGLTGAFPGMRAGAISMYCEPVPKMEDKGLSPIHELIEHDERELNGNEPELEIPPQMVTSNGIPDSTVHASLEEGLDRGEQEQRSYAVREKQSSVFSSSGVGRSVQSFESDSLNRCLPADSFDAQSAAINERRSSNISFQSTRSLEPEEAIVHVGGRLSVLKNERAPSGMCVDDCKSNDHRQHTRITWADGQDYANVQEMISPGSRGRNRIHKIYRAHMNKRSSVSEASGSDNDTQSDKTGHRSPVVSIPSTPLAQLSRARSEALHDGIHSPLRQFSIQKWLADVHKYDEVAGSDDDGSSYAWKRRKTLNKEEKRAILRRLQPGLREKREAGKKREAGRDEENAVSGAYGQSEGITRRGGSLSGCNGESDQSNFNKSCDLLGLVVKSGVSQTKGGRVSCLDVVCAPRTLCIHGANCVAHCNQSCAANSQAVNKGWLRESEPIRALYVNDSERGASVLGGPLRKNTGETSPTRGASTFGEAEIRRGASAFCDSNLSDIKPSCKSAGDISTADDIISESKNQTELMTSTDDVRGASAFSVESLNPRYPQLHQDIRGAKPTNNPRNGFELRGRHAYHPQNSAGNHAPNTIRGENSFAFAEDNTSIANTSSVTLSMAVLSDKGDATDDNKSVASCSLGKIRGMQAGQTETVVEKYVKDKLTNDPWGVSDNVDQINFGNEVSIRKDSLNNTAEESYYGHENKTARNLKRVRAACVTSMDVVTDQDRKLDQLKKYFSMNEVNRKQKKSVSEGRAEINDAGALEEKYRSSEASLKCTHTAGEEKQPNRDTKEDKFIQPNRCSTPKDTLNDSENESFSRLAIRPISGLGKDSAAMFGLLKALKRETRVKTTALEKQKSQEEVTSGRNKSFSSCDEQLRGNEVPTEAVTGKLKVSLLYDCMNAANPILYITVLKACDLSLEDSNITGGVHIKMCVLPKNTTWQRTKSVSVEDKSSVFNDLFIVSGVKPSELQSSVLRFVLVSGNHDEPSGSVDVPLTDLRSRAKMKKTCILRRPGFKNGAMAHVLATTESTAALPVGALLLGLKYSPMEEKLLVQVLKARGLPAVTAAGRTDPYVHLAVKDDGKVVAEHRTATRWQQRNPVFDAKYVFDIEIDKMRHALLVLTIKNNAIQDTVIGCLKLGRMESLSEDHWNSMISNPGELVARWHKVFK